MGESSGLVVMFLRLWVRIPALYNGWTFFHLFTVNIVMLFEKTKINEKEAEEGHLFKDLGETTRILIIAWFRQNTN